MSSVLQSPNSRTHAIQANDQTFGEMAHQLRQQSSLLGGSQPVQRCVAIDDIELVTLGLPAQQIAVDIRDPLLSTIQIRRND